MLAQSPEAQQRLLLSSSELSAPMTNSLYTLTHNPLDHADYNELQGLVQTVLELWGGLKNQRGYYEFDTTVEPKAAFLSKPMDDCKNFLDTELNNGNIAFLVVL